MCEYTWLYVHYVLVWCVGCWPKVTQEKGGSGYRYEGGRGLSVPALCAVTRLCVLMALLRRRC